MRKPWCKECVKAVAGSPLMLKTVSSGLAREGAAGMKFTLGIPLFGT